MTPNRDIDSNNMDLHTVSTVDNKKSITASSSTSAATSGTSLNKRSKGANAIKSKTQQSKPLTSANEKI